MPRKDTNVLLSWEFTGCLLDGTSLSKVALFSPLRGRGYCPHFADGDTEASGDEFAQYPTATSVKDVKSTKSLQFLQPPPGWRHILPPPSLLPFSGQKERLKCHQGLPGLSSLAWAVSDYALIYETEPPGRLTGSSVLNFNCSEPLEHRSKPVGAGHWFPLCRWWWSQLRRAGADTRENGADHETGGRTWCTSALGQVQKILTRGSRFKELQGNKGEIFLGGCSWG